MAAKKRPKLEPSSTHFGNSPPDAPGDQVYKTARQIDPDLNVIVITGYPDSEILHRILQVSPVTVLKKPLKVEQLNQTMKIQRVGPERGLCTTDSALSCSQ